MENQSNKKVVDYCESILSIVDYDIAKIFRDFGYGNFPEQLPLLAQIARNLRTFCTYIENTNTQVGNSNGHKKGGTDCDDK